MDDNEFLNSHDTSYSEFYIIDAAEEARLRRIAYARFMAEQEDEKKKE